MIVDVFPFFNEYEILDIRLKILNDHVDKFVIVEHDIDFNNNKKPFNLESKIQILKDSYKNKIDYIKINSVPMLGNKWDQEIHQKNNLKCALDLYPNAYFLFGDLDEVPNPKFISQAIELYQKEGPCIFLLHWCINRWDVLLKQRWPGPVLGKFNDVIKAGGVRKFMCPRGSKSMHWKNPSYPELYPAGWHWSFFGDPSKVVEKLDAILEGNKIRRKMYGNDEKVIREGKLLIYLKKYYGESLDSVPTDLYPEDIKNILLNYPTWWK
jgi:hypothetical protein